jgi:hypothetical protein
VALTGWRSALERWRSVGQTAESGRERGEGGESGHAGGLGFTHHGRQQPWASLASRTFQSASFTISTHVRLYIGSKRDRTRAHRTAARVRPASSIGFHGSIVLSFFIYARQIYRGATGNHNATIPHAGPGDILH